MLLIRLLFFEMLLFICILTLICSFIFIDNSFINTILIGEFLVICFFLLLLLGGLIFNITALFGLALCFLILSSLDLVLALLIFVL